MRKRTAFIFLFLIILGGYTVHTHVLSSFFEWSLKHYCQSCLKAQLTYSEISQSGNQWVLRQPKIISNTPLDQGGYQMIAPLAAIEIAFSWNSGPVVTVDVAMEALDVDVGANARAIKEVLNRSGKEARFAIDVRSNVAVSDGKISVHTESKEAIAPLFFNVDMRSDTVKKGVAKFHFGDKDPKGQLEVSFEEEEEGTKELRLLFDEVACAPALGLIKNIFPDWTVCRVSDGFLKGSMRATLPVDGDPLIESRTVIRDLAFCHPVYEGEFYIPELIMEAVSKHVDGELTSVGTIGFSRASTLSFAKEGVTCWGIEALGGVCSFRGVNHAEIELDAMCRHAGDSRLLRLKGGIERPVAGQYVLNMDCRLHEEDSKNDTAVHLGACGTEGKWEKVTFESTHLTKSEFDFIQHIAAKMYPMSSSFEFKRGTADIAMQVVLDNSKLSEVRVHHFKAQELELLSSENWTFGAQEASGSLSIDCSNPDPLKALLTTICFENAHFFLPSLSESEEEKTCACSFSGMRGNLTMQRGEFKNSFLEGSFMGLKGRLDIEDSVVDEVLRIECEGDVRSLAASFLPSIAPIVDKHFSDEQVKVKAQVKRNTGGDSKSLAMAGNAFLVSQGQVGNEMKFGLDLNENFGISKDGELQKCWRSAVKGAVKSGWFDAERVALEKFVSPFIFQQDQIRLSGTGIFHGTFDHQGILLQYDAQDVVMENADFSVELSALSLPNVPLGSKYFIDFTDMKGKGSVPICQGTYFEKNSGLLFTDVNTTFNHEDGFGRMSQVEAFCNGMYFSGQIELDWSHPGPGIFDIDIKANEMQGKLSQMQQLCAHFNKPMFFLKVPLDGNLAFRSPGGHLHFAFKGSDYDLHAKIDGSLADGILKCPNADMELQELNLNFSYDHAANTLDFFDIQGTLFVGKPNHVEEYALVGERVFFTDYANDEAEFDVWVGDKKRDILCVVGRTRKVLRGSDGEPMLSMMLDHSKSHFGDVYPSVFQLTLKDWSQIESLKLVLDLQIKTLLGDLQRFSRTGLMFLSRGLLKGLNNLKTAEGGFNIDLSYDGERSLFAYEFLGNDVIIGKHKFQKLSLSGNKKNSTWSIEQLQLDDISLAADLLKDDHAWKVNFLGARIGDAVLAGLEGQYFDDSGKLDAKINLLEVDLSKLQGWPSLKNTVEEIALAGQFKASGVISADLNPDSPKKMSVDIDLTAALRGGIFKDLHFQDIENSSLHYKTGSGLVLKNIRTALKNSDDNSVQAGIYLEQAECSFSHKELVVDRLFFRIPSKNVERLTDSLQKNFPSVVKESVADVVRSLKYKDGLHGEVQGVLSCELSEPHCAMRLSLNDGIYELMGKDHDLRGFVLEYDPFELKISSIYRLQQEWLSTTIRSTASALDSGEIVVLDNPHLDPALQEYFRGGFKPLTIRWQIDPQDGFYVKKIEGRLRGISFDLNREVSVPLDDNCMYLSGQVQMNMNEARVLLDPELAADLASWKVGNGYNLQGLWTVDKHSDAPFSRSLCFHGHLYGKEFEFFGYQFNNLSAQTSYERGLMHIQDLLASDVSGSMHIAESICVPLMNSNWEVNIPFLALRNFRPGLLRALDGSPSTVGRSLNIRQLEIQEINGILGNRDSFVGKGRLAFVNPPRKNVQPAIFAIPAELLTRIGLDLAVLTPVRGAVYYQVENGKVVFTKFKDIYSKGKLSKFYLPNSGYQSCVDFDGNLDLQIRMKQYNLVFKLAELFTVNVQGSLSKPTYSLNKQ